MSTAEISITNLKVKAEGKRRVRVRENGRFASNPHIVPPQTEHYLPEQPTTKPTFPEPLPSFLPRSIPAPSAVRPNTAGASAIAGQFFTPFGGMRKSLRRHGHRSEYLIHHVERALIEWLNTVQVTLNPVESEEMQYWNWNEVNEASLQVPGQKLWEEGSPILEVARSQKRLVWRIDGDTFARYVVHCCCRFHSIVSYSKDVNGKRFTFLLRPMRGLPGVEAMVTPSATDYDSASSVGDQLDTMSLGGTEPDSNLTPVSEGETEEIDSETDFEMKEADTILRAPTHFRWTSRVITDMKKQRFAYDAGSGRDQSLLSYVFP